MRHQQSGRLIQNRLRGLILVLKHLELRQIRRFRWNELLISMNGLYVSFHVAWIDERLSTILACKGLVEMVAERFLAQLLIADAANEIFRIALQVLADVHLERFF